MLEKYKIHLLINKINKDGKNKKASEDMYIEITDELEKLDISEMANFMNTDDIFIKSIIIGINEDGSLIQLTKGIISTNTVSSNVNYNIGEFILFSLLSTISDLKKSVALQNEPHNIEVDMGLISLNNSLEIINNEIKRMEVLKEDVIRYNMAKSILIDLIEETKYIDIYDRISDKSTSNDIYDIVEEIGLYSNKKTNE